MNKILIVDDVAENLAVTKDLLQDLIPDCLIFTAQSGKEGLTTARDEQPDTIITDIKMPEMDGYELCRRLKADEATENIPIMILTGSKVDAEWRVKCLEAGADVFLSKPVDASELIAQINVMLRCKKAEDRLLSENERLENTILEKTTELKESEEKYRSIYENMHIGIYRTTPDGKILFANPALIEILKYDSFEDLKTRDLELSGYFPKKSREEFKKEINENKQIRGFESTWLRADGKKVYIRENAKAFYDKDGNIKYYEGTIEDITERKIAEQNLKASEEKYRALVENANVSIFTIDSNGIYLFLNSIAAKELGGKPEDFIGKTLWDVFPKEIAERQMNSICELIKLGKGRISEQKTVLQGQDRWYRTNSQPVKDEKGEIYAVMIIGTDITERKRAEEKINILAHSLRSINECVSITDTKDIIYFVNDAYPKTYGYTKGELIGKHISILHPKHVTLEIENMILKKTIECGWSGELVNQKKDGTIFPVYLSTSVIKDDKENIIGLVGVTTDITERKRAEEIQKTIFNISNTLSTVDNMQGLYTKIREFLGDVIDTNNFYIALYDEKTDIISFAYYADETFSKKNYLPASRKFGNGLTEYVIKTGKPLFATEDVVNELINKGLIESIGSPSEIWLGVPLNIENKVIGVIAVQSYYDPNLYTEKDIEILNFISEEIALAIDRKKAEEELKINRERLRIANSILRHDITNDIVVIKSALDIYRDENDITMLDEIDKRIEKSINTIKKQREQEKFIDSHLALVEYKIEKVANKIIKNYSDLEINVTGTGKVYADNAIYSVFENIMSNAILHGKTKKIDIEINSEEDYCVIRIADHGIGIPDEYKYDIFEKGFKYGPHGHTGIGLYIVQKTIEDYGGTIHVEDNKPHGAVFVLRLRKVIKK